MLRRFFPVRIAKVVNGIWDIADGRESAKSPEAYCLRSKRGAETNEILRSLLGHSVGGSRLRTRADQQAVLGCIPNSDSLPTSVRRVRLRRLQSAALSQAQLMIVMELSTDACHLNLNLASRYATSFCGRLSRQPPVLYSGSSWLFGPGTRLTRPRCRGIIALCQTLPPLIGRTLLVIASTSSSSRSALAQQNFTRTHAACSTDRSRRNRTPALRAIYCVNC